MVIQGTKTLTLFQELLNEENKFIINQSLGWAVRRGVIINGRRGRRNGSVHKCSG